ncbi:hypothetical protein [Rhodohalobacter sp.]|uniref:hypothetical protein n=2 Tax=Rhodohalobacter sp. TaxID=1974210 RepID=UPI003563A980
MLPLILALFLSWLPLSPQSVDGDSTSESRFGNRIALSFDSVTDEAEKQQLLVDAAEIGIDLIHFTRADQLTATITDDFFLIYQYPDNYTTVNSLRHRSAEITADIRNSLQTLTDQYPDRIISAGLFRYPNEKHPQFNAYTTQIADSIREFSGLPVFYQSALPGDSLNAEGFDFTVQTIIPGNNTPAANALFFDPGKNVQESKKTLENLFRHTLEFEESLLIIPADWFQEYVAGNDDYKTIFSEYLEGNLMPFPVPQTPEVPPAMNWNVVFLFLILGSILIHMRFQPVYIQTLPRYFFNHSFFLVDVIEHRIRNIFPGVIILLQHSVVTGLILYLTADSLFNERSLSALSYHFPAVFWPASPYVSLFLAGFFVSLMMQIVSVLWLHLPNKRLQFFSQTLNLYAWPLHVNFLVATVLIVFHNQSPGQTLISLLLVSYLIVWFMSFNVAAYDAAKFLEKYSLPYILFTIGLHTLLFVFLIWFTVNSPAIREPIQMALSFS